MKKLLRAFSAMLCISLILAAVPVDAALITLAEEADQIVVDGEVLAEEAEDVPEAEATQVPAETDAPDVRPEATEAPAETDAPEATAAPTAAPTAESSAEPSAEPTAAPSIEPTAAPSADPTAEPGVEPTAEPTAEPTPEAPAIDYTTDAGESPTFESGYAEVLSGESVAYQSGKKDAAEYAVLGRGVVYAVSRSKNEPDRICVAFNPDPEKGVETAWVDAKNLRPMNPASGEEVERYLAACAKDENARNYNENEAIPLRVIPCAYPKVEISLNKRSAVIGVNDSGFDLDVSFSDGGDHAVRFESSKPKYAKVDAVTGVVTGLRTGSAVIKAITEFGELECAVTIKKAPRSVTVKPKNGELAIGERAALSVSFGSASYGGSCRYVSSDPEIAAVDENGVVTGVSKGTAVISVYVYSQPKKPAEATITVLGPATQLSFTADALTLDRGADAKPELVFLPGERDSIRYSSDNSKAVSVDPDGTIHALSEGTAVITAVTPGGVKASCMVQVLPAPTEAEIVLRTGSCKLGLNERIDMMELLQVADVAHARFTFASSKPKIVSVDENGMIKGLKKGSSVIRATTQNGIIRDLKVTVCALPKSVSFAKEQLAIGVGTSAATELNFYRESAYSLCSYVSSNEAVATVDANGVVTGISAGTAVITANPLSGKPGSCMVIVKAAPASIGVAEEVISLGCGETGRRVVGTHSPDTLCSFSYASMDESVVKVDAASGELTALAEGSTEVIVTAQNGVSAACTVHVLKSPTHLELNETQIRIMVGERYTGLSAIVDEGTASGLTLTSSKTKYAKIEENAIVGLRKGTAVITAQTYNGLTATCKVTVCEAPKSIVLTNADQGVVRLGVQETAEIAVGFKPESSYSPITYHSKDESIVRYDEAAGMLVAVGEGETSLVLETLNGVKAVCRAVVLPAPENIRAMEEELRMGVGEKGRCVQGVAPEGTLCSFSYESLNPEIARVDAETGVLTALSAGTAEIRISAHNGVTANCSVHVTPAPQSLTLSHENLKIIVGERNTDLKGVMNDGAASALALTSSKPKYVKIEDGAIVGLRIGTAIVTAETYNGVKASCRVTVAAAPTAIYFEDDALQLGCGESALTMVGFRPASTAGRLRYESDQPDIASVDPDTGEVHGISVGTAVITATALNGLKDQCTVQVFPAPQSLRFENGAYELSVGMQAQLNVLLSDGAMGGVSFESSDKLVAAVDANGVVTAVSEGTAEITARSYNGLSTVCTLNICAEPALAHYDFDRLIIRKGDVIRIPAPEITDVEGNPCPADISYASSRTGVASINASGELKALRNGTAEITATTHNGLEAYFELVVSDKTPMLSLSPEKLELYTDGAGFAETAQLTSDSAESLSYDSSDPDVAVVDDQGCVTAVGAGSAVISVRASGGSYAAVEVTVHRLTATIGLGIENAELGVGESMQLEPVIDPGTSAVISYAVDNPAVAQVDANGLVYAVGAGTALVTASIISGRTAVLQLNVLPGPTVLEFGSAELVLVLGEETTLKPIFTAGAEDFCSRLRYTSSDSSIVSVDGNGKVAALSEGSVIITAESCNGLKASCVVSVSASIVEDVFGFTMGTYSIAAGDRAELPVFLGREAYERGYSIASSDPDLLQADANAISASTLRTGEAVLTLTLNPDPAHPDAPAQSVSCTVSVVAETGIELDAEELEVQKGESAALAVTLTPTDLIGSFRFEIEKPELISYDPDTGLIAAGEIEGETTISFHTYNASAACRVIVRSGTRYRALIIGEYNDSGADNDLPFAENNLYTVRNTLRYSSVYGEGYEITTAFNNPGKASIRSLLMNTFAEADEDDVSLIYIMSHGYYGSAANGYFGYYFSIAPNYDKNRPSTYVTADELMLALRSIPGKVIFVLDSCKSGGFIRDARGELAECGNIAVFTAQTYDKGASFYVGKNEATTVEFFTYALCYGLGVQQRSNYLSSMPADNNDDGYVTVEEAFSYARKETKSLIADKIDTYKKGSKTGFFVPGGLDDDWSQNPQKFIPDEMEDLVFYGREAEETPAA